MQKINYMNLVSHFSPVDIDKLKWLSPITQIKSLIVEKSQQPENLADSYTDPMDFIVLTKYDNRKKNPSHNHNLNHQKEFNMGKKASSTHQEKQTQVVKKETPAQKEHQTEEHNEEEKKKVYKPGQFALFYELNEGKLEKDQEVWYYKENKDIIGPVSSYNMDKMAYYKNVEDETRVAYQSVEKFVKFSKIKKIVSESLKKKAEEEEQKS